MRLEHALEQLITNWSARLNLLGSRTEQKISPGAQGFQKNKDAVNGAIILFIQHQHYLFFFYFSL